jgi:hypothetical protein
VPNEPLGQSHRFAPQKQTDNDRFPLPDVVAETSRAIKSNVRELEGALDG